MEEKMQIKDALEQIDELLQRPKEERKRLFDLLKGIVQLDGEVPAGSIIRWTDIQRIVEDGIFAEVYLEEEVDYVLRSDERVPFPTEFEVIDPPEDYNEVTHTHCTVYVTERFTTWTIKGRIIPGHDNYPDYVAFQSFEDPTIEWNYEQNYGVRVLEITVPETQLNIPEPKIDLAHGLEDFDGGEVYVWFFGNELRIENIY